MLNYGFDYIFILYTYAYGPDFDVMEVKNWDENMKTVKYHHLTVQSEILK